MMLHLITGVANSGKTGRAYAALRDHLARGERCALVLPSAPDVQRARHELAASAFLGLDIVTLDGLVRSLWSLTGDGREIVQPDERALALSSSLPEGESRSYARLASRCVDVLCDQCGNSWRAGQPRDVPGEGRALAEIISGYGMWLDANERIEQREAMHLLAGMDAGRFYGFIAVHRFSDLSPSQVTLLKGLARDTHLMLTLTAKPGFAPTAAVDGLVDRLAAEEHEELLEQAYNTHPVLTELTGRLFSSPKTLQSDQTVTFLLAEGEEAQARAIAKEIAGVLRDGVVESGSDIAVVFRDAEVHHGSLARAFRDEGLAADFDVRVPLRSTSYGAALLMALEAVTGRHDRLLALVRSGLLSLTVEERRRLEAEWRGSGQRDVPAMIGRLSRHDEGVARYLSVLAAARDRALGVGDLTALADLASTLHARSLNVERLDPQRAQLDAAAQAGVAKALESMRDCLSLGVSLSDAVDLFETRQVAPLAVEREGHVQVTSAARVRGRRFEVVVVAGLNAGEFPAAPDETINGGNALAEILGAFGGSAPEVNPLFEQLLFYDMVTRARKRLVLCACVSDSEAQPQRLSPFFEVVADFFRSEQDEMPPHKVEPLAVLPDDSDTAERTRLRAASAEDCPSCDRAAAAAYRARRKVVSFTIPDWNAEALSFSASQIEAYLACPYRWYRQRVLNPRELEREYGPLDEGSFAHSLLVAVYRELHSVGISNLEAASLPTALSLLDSSFAGLAADLTTVPEKAGALRARSWALRMLQEDAERIDTFFPAQLEWDFGGEESSVQLGSFALRGRIDRIDTDGEGRAIVVDYKRRVGVENGAQKVISEGKVQIPLYMLVAKETLGLDVVGGLYRGLSVAQERGMVVRDAIPERRLTATDKLEADDLQALLQAALGISEEAVEGMRSGYVAPEPRSAKVCETCRMSALCGGAR